MGTYNLEAELDTAARQLAMDNHSLGARFVREAIEKLRYLYGIEKAAEGMGRITETVILIFEDDLYPTMSAGLRNALEAYRKAVRSG